MTARDDFDDRLDEAARALAERLPALDASLDDEVMAAVRRHGAPAAAAAPRPLRWLLEPRAVRVRPIWAPVLALAALLVLSLLPRASRPGASEAGTTVASAARDTVFVQFELTAPDARAVAVAGSFNGWSASALPLIRTASGAWAATIALPVGEHRYQFVVDGTRWVPDPAAQSQVDDGFGGTNSVIVVGPKGLVRS